MLTHMIKISSVAANETFKVKVMDVPVVGRPELSLLFCNTPKAIIGIIIYWNGQSVCGQSVRSKCAVKVCVQSVRGQSVRGQSVRGQSRRGQSGRGQSVRGQCERVLCTYFNGA